MKILLIDDDPLIHSMVNKVLSEGMTIDSALTAEESNEMVSKKVYDLVILDIHLELQNGLDVLTNFREKKLLSNSYVILLSADNSTSSLVLGQELSIDEFIQKPLDPYIFSATLRKYQKRTKSKDGSKIIMGILELDKSLMKVRIKKNDDEFMESNLTTSEYKILTRLIEQYGQNVSRDELAQILNDSESSAFERKVDMRVSSLRKKIGEAAHYIKSVRSIGYKFCI